MNMEGFYKSSYLRTNPVTYNLHNYVPCLDIEDMLPLNDTLYVGFLCK